MGSHVWATVASESVPRANNSPQGLGSLLQGLGILRIHVRRAPRDGLASAPTEPQLPTMSSHDDLHVARTGQGLPVTVLTTMHMVDAHASLCCQLLLRGQRSVGSHVWATVASESVPRTNNSLQGLGSLLQGLGSLRTHVRRSPPRWLGLGACRATAPYDVITR